MPSFANYSLLLASFLITSQLNLPQSAFAQSTKGELKKVLIIPDKLSESQTGSAETPNLEIKLEGSGSCSIRIRGYKTDGAFLGEQTLFASLPKSTYWSSKGLGAGQYKFVVEVNPAVMGALDKCTGKHEVALTVTKSSTQISANQFVPGLVSNPCSNGWTLVTGSVTAAGAFTCKPSKAYPKQPCPPKHEWFEDGCNVGCRQVAY